MQADLNNGSSQLKIFKTTDSNENYPTAIDCSTTPAANTICLKPSGSNIFEYTVNNSTNPKTFQLCSYNGTTKYCISESTGMVAVTVPVLIDPTSVSVTSTSAVLGANIISQGSTPVTEVGTCWGTAPNPTTNCTSRTVGALTPLNPSTISAGVGAESIAISSDGKSVYALNSGANSISMYSRDLSTGQLTSIGTESTAGLPKGIAISPDGISVYVANTNSASVWRYNRNISTGALSYQETITLTGSINDIVVSNDNKSVYVMRQNGTTIYMYSRNTTNGVLTALSPATIAGSGSNQQHIAISPDDKSVYVSNVTGSIAMFRRDTATGVLTNASPSTITGDYGPTDIAISPDNTSVYINSIDTNSIGMYNRNVSSSVLSSMTPASVSSAGTSPYGIVITSDGGFVYISNYYSGISMFSRNTSTGALTVLDPSTISVGASVYANYLVISPDSAYIYSTNYNGKYVSMFSRNFAVSSGVYGHYRSGGTFNTGTTYYYRGYAKNSIGTGYSPDGTFVGP